MMSRQYQSRTDNHAGFISTVLLAGSVWVHKAVMAKVEHYALIFAIACSIAVALAILYKPFKIIRSWYYRSNRRLESVDTMTGLQFEQVRCQSLKTTRLYERSTNRAV